MDQTIFYEQTKLMSYRFQRRITFITWPPTIIRMPVNMCAGKVLLQTELIDLFLHTSRKIFPQGR